MIIFANADGSIAAVSPSRITQGSVDANKLVLVGPFSNSVVTIAFTLPNGFVLGPNIAGLPEEYTTTEEEYTMTELNDGKAVYTGLYAYSYTLNKSITSTSGTLGIQFFISTKRGTEENPTYTDTLATYKVNVPVYNGSRYIPEFEVPSSSGELMSLLSDIITALANTIKIDSGGVAQSIQSNLGVEGNLAVGGSSNLGHTAYVVDDSGKATVTLDGDTGTVNATKTTTHEVIVNEDETETSVKTVITYNKIAVAIDENDDAATIIEDDAVTTGDVQTKSITAGTITAETIQPKGSDTTNTFAKSVYITQNLDVGGNVSIKGNTVLENTETLLVKDNIIVTNSSGASFSTSGLVIKLPSVGDDGSNAYGILYVPDPNKDAVMIGKGVLESELNEAGEIVSYAFSFSPNQELPLAARLGFDNTKDGYIPQWDHENFAFVPSSVKGDNIASITYVDEQIGNVASILHQINEGGIPQ